MWSRRGNENCRRDGENGEEGMEEDWIMERMRGWQRRRGTERSTREETRVMGFFLHSCSIPLFFRLKTIATLSAMSEPEVVASAFHRQAAIHSSGSSQPIGNQRGRAAVQRVPRNVSAIDLFPGWPIPSSQSTPKSLFYSPPHYLHCSLLSPSVFQLVVLKVWRVWWGGRVRRGCSLTLNKPRRPHKRAEGLLPNKNTVSHLPECQTLSVTKRQPEFDNRNSISALWMWLGGQSMSEICFSFSQGDQWDFCQIPAHLDGINTCLYWLTVMHN